MQRIKSGLTALAVGIVLLAALDWAAAAGAGPSMVLGKWDQAHRTPCRRAPHCSSDLMHGHARHVIQHEAALT